MFVVALFSDSCAPARRVNYFHRLSADPFGFMMFYEEQIKYYVAMCKEDEAVWHFDASGSFFVHLQGQKRALTYSLVPFGHGIVVGDLCPIVEFVTTDGTTHSIKSYLETMKFLAAGKSPTVKPKVIVTDWSWAMIMASCEAFNEYILEVYYAFLWKVVNHTATRDQINNTTFLVICNAHFMHAVQGMLKNMTSVSKAVRKWFLKLMQFLSNCPRYLKIRKMVKRFTLVCSCRYLDHNVQDALDRISKNIDVAPPDAVYDVAREEWKVEVPESLGVDSDEDFLLTRRKRTLRDTSDFYGDVVNVVMKSRLFAGQGD